MKSMSDTNNENTDGVSDPNEVTLRANVKEVMRHYFANLQGEKTSHIYDFFLDEIEEPLLVAVMRFTDGNQSEAARILGVSRGTLRAKLEKFGML